MTENQSIILVPGLFGFARIGEIDYFAAVEKLLASASQIEDITTLATPPTGALWRRVDALHRCVLEKVKQGRSKVHVVGHSTGGVDARLLTNSKYLWPDGPCGVERAAFFDRMGAVIGVSAPQWGTPIARRLRGALEDVVPLLFLASVLAKYRSRDGGGLHVRDRLELSSRLTRALVHPSSEQLSLKGISGLSVDAASRLRTFLDEIVEDHPLIHELTPLAMKRLNDKIRIDSAADGQELPVSSFVTVAPPPSLHRNDFRGLAPFQRVFYAASYGETRFEPDDREFGDFPRGPWIGEPPRGLADFERTAQDGVVPAASQTLDGRAVGLVFADHIDVVGHYPGAELGGETVFDSGADFDDARMKQLWSSVGEVIVRAGAQPSRTAAVGREAHPV